MDILLILCFCIVSTVVCKISENSGSEIKPLVVLSAVIAVFSVVIGVVLDISVQLRELFTQAQLNDDYMKILFKALGVCYVTQLASDYCKDCGENALANQALLAGKISLLLISMPLFNALVEIVKTLLI